METVRDKLFDGVAAIAIGVGPVGLAIALAAFHEEVTTSTLAFILCGVPFFLMGAFWITRKVTFAPTTLTVTTWLGQRTIRVDEIASIRVKNASLLAPHAQAPGFLDVKDRSGATARVNLRGPALQATRAWFPRAVDSVLSQWSHTFACDKPVHLSKRMQLAAALLDDRKTRIDLAKPFSLEDVPAGPGTNPLLRISQGEERIVVDGGMDNFLPLREYLRRQHRVRAPDAV